jgi:hypothetical protein
MMNYTQAVAHITYALGNRTDVSTYAGRWLNWAYNDLWEYADAHNKEDIADDTLAEDDSSIAIPDGTYQILRVVVDGTDMERRGWKEYTEIETFASAKPTKYYIFGANIYFDTEADDDYDVEVWRIKNPSVLSGTSTPDLPDYYEAPLISRAIAYGFRDLQMSEESAAWFKISSDQLLSIKQQHWKENEDWSRGIRPSPRRRTR